MGLVPLTFRPMEQLPHLADQPPMKGTPPPVPLFQPIKSVLPGFADEGQISSDEIRDAADVHETHVHHGIHQLKDRVPIIFLNPGRGEMASDMKLLENFFHLDIQVGKRLLENRFDLSLKSGINCVMDKEASFLWFL